MAEMLIWTGNKPSRQYGDIIAVRPAGWGWGSRERGEGNAPFAVVSIPEAPVDNAYAASWESDGILVARSRYRVSAVGYDLQGELPITAIIDKAEE